MCFQCVCVPVVENGCAPVAIPTEISGIQQSTSFTTTMNCTQDADCVYASMRCVSHSCACYYAWGRAGAHCSEVTLNSAPFICTWLVLSLLCSASLAYATNLITCRRPRWGDTSIILLIAAGCSWLSLVFITSWLVINWAEVLSGGLTFEAWLRLFYSVNGVGQSLVTLGVCTLGLTWLDVAASSLALSVNRLSFTRGFLKVYMAIFTILLLVLNVLQQPLTQACNCVDFLLAGLTFASVIIVGNATPQAMSANGMARMLLSCWADVLPLARTDELALLAHPPLHTAISTRLGSHRLSQQLASAATLRQYDSSNDCFNDPGSVAAGKNPAATAPAAVPASTAPAPAKDPAGTGPSPAAADAAKLAAAATSKGAAAADSPTGAATAHAAATAPLSVPEPAPAPHLSQSVRSLADSPNSAGRSVAPSSLERDDHLVAIVRTGRTISLAMFANVLGLILWLLAERTLSSVALSLGHLLVYGSGAVSLLVLFHYIELVWLQAERRRLINHDRDRQSSSVYRSSFSGRASVTHTASVRAETIPV